MNITKIGDRVQIHYTGRFDDDTVFDSSQGQDPLEFIAGSNEVIPGVSQAVVGMKPGESKTIEIAAEEAYGPRQPGLEQRVPRNLIPPEASVGDPLQARVGEQTYVVWVMEVGDDFAVLDGNHPLAGRNLIFDIELVSVTDGEV
ncbi:MAG: peptidylprolyl isomerase [Deltaproteobacteria bacterium]|nr:peptidylprolyl isomerase [Deltaproteobacteria bacterium]MBW1953500.1 peptidylprolyl isomerase [Deltaproteobacteria bacterium]MBW1987214.1 peptidylprolyl isomerase [Deltaproteobacteria bacterium]MBW2134306.1 peptidylprolyl isomerase [Deltaproteobacteria bacterium]